MLTAAELSSLDRDWLATKPKTNLLSGPLQQKYALKPRESHALDVHREGNTYEQRDTERRTLIIETVAENGVRQKHQEFLETTRSKERIRE